MNLALVGVNGSYDNFLFSHNSDQRLIEFLAKLIQAKRSNSDYFVKHKRPITAERFKTLNPQEELFSKFFAEEAILVSNMDDISLKAHREELAQIAFEARARLHAVDSENRERTKKGRKFSSEDDANAGADLASDAINAIKARQKKLSKMDKVKQNLINMGVDPAEAERIISSRNIRDNSPSRVEANKAKPVADFNPFPNKTPEPKVKPGEINWDKVIAQAVEADKVEKKPIDFGGLNFKK